MNAVKRISSILQYLLHFAMWFIPIFVLIYWTFFEVFVDFGFSRFVLFYDRLTITPLSKMLALFSSMIPVAIFCYIFRSLRKLFKNYEHGKIFVLENVYFYKKIGLALIVLAFGNAVYSALLSTAVSFQSEKTFLLIDFSSNELIYMLVGAFIYLVSYVMKKGHNLNNILERTI